MGYIKHDVGPLQVSTPNETYLNSTFDGLPLKRANTGYTCNTGLHIAEKAVRQTVTLRLNDGP
ncbi:hypothetical protein MKX08_004185 [Trichoderma sp. CBMAI-0020]|nr:hypothetical protein MKX08_004185 [Trichoderma sp. CBMAI-0020]